MAKHNLAQHEQLLKSLKHSFKEIGDIHKQMHDILDVMQINVHQACHDLNVSWSKVINLFVIVDQLRSSRLELEKETEQLMTKGEFA